MRFRRQGAHPVAVVEKACIKPSLTTHGALKDITTGGSGKSTERSNGKKPRP